jgi:hypothetical protein
VRDLQGAISNGDKKLNAVVLHVGVGNNCEQSRCIMCKAQHLQDLDNVSAVYLYLTSLVHDSTVSKGFHSLGPVAVVLLSERHLLAVDPRKRAGLCTPYEVSDIDKTCFLQMSLVRFS